jgi:hypothetical protein
MKKETPGFFLFSKTTTINPAPDAAVVCHTMPRATMTGLMRMSYWRKKAAKRPGFIRFTNQRSSKSQKSV